MIRSTKYHLLILITLLAMPGNSQEIDPSLLENLTPEQIKMAQEQFNINTTPINETIKEVSESTIEAPLADINIVEDKKYGYDFFTSVPTTISAVGDLPIPNDYKISLNDQLTIILSGSKEAIFDLNVNLDGTILFPELGSVYIAGETFGDVKLKLQNLISQSYIGVQIDLSLKNLSAKKITIVGAVKTPGTYLVNPFSTISSALAYSGGISEIGTLRDIKLIRTNGDTFNFDLYKLLIKGDRSEDITIEAGDVILINPAQQFIKINGAVKRSSIYEVKDSETLNDLIGFALGFTDTANKSNINLEILDINSASIININAPKLSFVLDNVKSVEVFDYINKYNANISVSGAINKPGFYSLKENPTLESLINNLQFVNVYPWLGVLEQFDEKKLTKSNILFSLRDPSTYESIKLLPNSSVNFANIDSRLFNVSSSAQRKIEDYSLLINHKGDSYVLPVFGKFSIESFIDLLGLDMTDVDTEATYIRPLDGEVITSDYREMEFTATKYHTVSLRSPVNNLIKVEIKGEVDYPGIYTLELKATIQDLYELAGEFKKEAFLDGIIFTRISVRERQLKAIQESQKQLNESILINAQKGEQTADMGLLQLLAESIESENLGRIGGDYSPDSFSSKNTMMFDGDSIIVPKNPYTINVFGEVLNPISFEYKKGMSIEDAIDRAGGYKDYAKKNSVYIIKANGITEKASRNIFVGNTKLEPGDSIIVPRKIITNNPVSQALLPVTQIISDLAFSAAAIESLSNSNN